MTAVRRRRRVPSEVSRGLRTWMACAALALAALAVAAPAHAGGTPGALPNTDPRAANKAVEGLIGAFAEGIADLERAARRPATQDPSLEKEDVVDIARSSGPLNDWLADHPETRVDARVEDDGRWKVSFVSGPDDDETVEAEVYVSDETAEIVEVRTGPQVAWLMARGYDGAFGRGVNEPAIWTALSLAFLLPFLEFRRLLSWRTLDLLALLALTLSWIWFNKGEIFTSVPLQYPPLLYLGGRLAWIGIRRSRERRATTDDGDRAEDRPLRPRLGNWCPTWLMVTLLICVLALRYGLNAFDSNVIDVGYAGVLGADLITEGQTPYGNFPSNCGRCDTYGPLVYMLYVPFESVIGFSGEWDSLPAAHAAATFFDMLAVLGMLMLGWRLAGLRMGIVLALGWAALPWTAYALESNANDALVGALLAWGLAFASRPMARGVSVALATAAKFTPALLVPLWLRHPFPRAPRAGARRRAAAFAGGIGVAVLACGWVLFLDGTDGVRAIWSRTIGYQADRSSPFSLWGQYPGLRPIQVALGVLVIAAAIALLRWPRRMDLLSMAAFSGTLMIGAQLTLEHWFYLYVPWFVPFTLLVMLPRWTAPTQPSQGREPARTVGEPVAVGT